MDDNGTKRLSRLTAILLQLQTRRLITATMLAEKFDVSIRTIYRDIRALEESGVPIVTEEGKGYSLMDGYRIPPVSFTESEANALITAEQLILKNKDSSLIRDYTEAVSKVKSVLRQSTRDNVNLLSDRIAISQYPENDHTSQYLSELQLALTNFNLTTIAYRKPDTDESSVRTIEPFALMSTQGNWLLLAWCRLRKEFRLFRVDRMQSVQVQTEKFEPHTMTLAQYFERFQKDEW
jgi:predicted DNA-binding transcriptional regulator YafY